MNKLKLLKLRHSLRSSYWFVPILMMALAMWLALARYCQLNSALTKQPDRTFSQPNS